jgi:signal transduction histidine kinase
LDCAVSDIAALDPLTEQAVYRIATEALTNIERHAGAKHVRLNLSLENRKLRLAIQDDGIGFDPRIIPEDHFGVTGMGERAREAGGALKVQSELGKGTTLELEIPV